MVERGPENGTSFNAERTEATAETIETMIAIDEMVSDTGSIMVVILRKRGSIMWSYIKNDLFHCTEFWAGVACCNVIYAVVFGVINIVVFITQ